MLRWQVALQISPYLDVVKRHSLASNHLMFLLCPLVLVREGPVYSLSLAIQHQGAKELGPLEKFLLRSYVSNLQNNKRFIFSPLGDIFAGPNLTLLITDILNHLHPFGMQNTTVLLHNNDLGLNLNVLRLIVYCKNLKSSHRHLLLVLNFWQTISGLRSRS